MLRLLIVLVLLAPAIAQGQQAVWTNARGATTAGYPTSTIIDADHRALDIRCWAGCGGAATQDVNVTQLLGSAPAVTNPFPMRLSTGVAFYDARDRSWTLSSGSDSVTVVQGTGTNLHIVCDSGCGGAASFQDDGAFTFGTTAVNISGGVLDDVATATCTENSACAPRITAQKGVHVNLRNNAGAEVGTSGAPLRTDPTGTTTQPVSGTVTANQGTANATPWNENVAQVGGASVSTAASGVQKVGVVGNAGAAFDAANNAAAPANVLVGGAETATQTSTQPAAATAGNVRRVVAGTDGVLFVKQGGPVQWQCNLGTIGTTLTQCQAAPGAGLRLYITDILAVSSTTTSGLFTLRFGTGSNCGTGTGNVFFNSASASIPNGANNATSVKPISFITPVAITANNAVCVLGVATNTTNIMISGYTAP